MRTSGNLKKVAGLVLFTLLLALLFTTSCAQSGSTSTSTTTVSSAAQTATTTSSAPPSTSPPAQQNVIEWRMQSGYPGSDLSTSLQGKTIVDTLNQKLAGKLHITLYEAGQIVPEDSMFDDLQSGVYEATLYGGSWYAGVLPEALPTFGLPFSLQGSDQLFDFYYNFGFLKFERDAHAKIGIFFVCPLPTSPLVLEGNFAANTVADLKGKKIWAGGGNAIYMQNLGAAPTFFPTTELYTSLKLGTIDGFIYDLAELKSSGYQEVVKYVNWPAVLNPGSINFLVNLKAWNALTPDMQKTIDDTMKEIGPSLYAKYDAANNEGLASAKASGVQEVTMAASEQPALLDAASKTWDAIAAKSPGAADAVKMVRDYLTSKGVIK